MKTFLAFLAISLSMPSLSKASTVTLSSTSTGPSVVTSTAVNLVPNGSLIIVGTFIGGIETLANWREFGLSSVKSAGGGPSARASKVTGSVTNNNAEADDSQFNGLPVYIWIYNSTTISATADQGIFKSTFLFPNNDTSGTGDSVTPTAVSFVGGIALEGFGTSEFRAGVNNLTGSTTGGLFILGAAVPEVSTSSLMLMSILGLAAIRRRR